MQVSASPLMPGDIADLLGQGLRAADIREAATVTGLRAEEALVRSVAHSVLAGTIRINGRAAALFGVSAEDALLHTGSPWLAASAAFESPAAAIPLARIMRRFLDHWLTVFSRLENYTDPRHTAALNFLRRAGFCITPAPITGPRGHSLVCFWKNA